MKKLAFLLVVLMALPVCVRAGDVTISGTLEFNAIHRENVNDWSDNPSDIDLIPPFGLVTIPHQGPNGLLGDADDGQDDQENFVDVYVEIDITAELVDNVMAKVQLGNSRHATDRFGEDGFVLEVKEALVQMKEFVVPELTATLGLMNVAYALRDDGNYFLINTKESFNLGQDPTDYGIDVGGVLFNIDLQPLSFDAGWVRALDGGTTGAYVDMYLAGMHYFFPDEKSYLQLLAVNVHDNSNTAAVTYDDVLKEYPTYVGAPFLDSYQGIVESSDWWALSAGLQYFLDVGAAELELYGEAVWELGDYSDSDVNNPYKAVFDQDDSVDMDAFGGRVGAELTFADAAMKPTIGVSYWYRSGDSDPGDDDQENFVSYGKTVETLIAEDALYGYNLNTNYEAWRISLAVDPVECLTVKLQYNDFTIVEDNFEQGLIPPRPVFGAPPLVFTNFDSEDEFGQELDLTATYTYSENVTMMLGVGMLWPDDNITGNPRLGRRDNIFDDSGDDDEAFLVDFRTVVTF